MSRKEFLRLSPREFYYVLEMYHNQKITDYYYQRLNTSLIMSSLVGKQIQPTELYTLSDAEQIEMKRISDNNYKRNSKEMFDKMNSKYKEAIEFSLKDRVN